jgi:hypothetical protein
MVFLALARLGKKRGEERGGEGRGISLPEFPTATQAEINGEEILRRRQKFNYLMLWNVDPWMMGLIGGQGMGKVASRTTFTRLPSKMHHYKKQSHPGLRSPE